MMRFKIILGFILITLLYSCDISGQQSGKEYEILEEVVTKTSEILSTDTCDFYTVEKSFKYSSKTSIGSIDNDAAIKVFRQFYNSTNDLVNAENTLYLALSINGEERKNRLDAWRKKYALENTEAAQLKILCSYARFLHYDYIVNPEQLKFSLPKAYAYYKGLQPKAVEEVIQEEENYEEQGDSPQDAATEEKKHTDEIPTTSWQKTKSFIKGLFKILLIGLVLFILFFTGKGKKIRHTVFKNVKGLFKSNPPVIRPKDSSTQQTETFDKNEFIRLLKEDEDVKKYVTHLFLNMLKDDINAQSAIINMVQISKDNYGEISRQILNSESLYKKIASTVDDKIEEALAKNKPTREMPVNEVYQPVRNQNATATPTSGTHYSGIPQNGAFAGRELQSEVKQGMTFYELKISASGNEATFRPVTEKVTFQRAMDVADTYLKPACDLIGDPKSARKYEIKENGIAIKENNNWKITKKAIIEFF